MIGPATKLSLSVQCNNVVKLDVFSESDPFVVLYSVDNATGRRTELGRTETCMNSPNPQFAKTFLVDYYFETVQPLVFAVYDEDKAGAPLSQQDFVGEVEVRLSQIVGLHRGRFTADLKHPKEKRHRGSITVIAEELSHNQDTVSLKLRASNCKRPRGRGLLGGISDLTSGNMQCFLQISQDINGAWPVAHRTETAAPSKHPVFKPIQISANALCNGQVDRRLRFELFEHRSNGKHLLLGTAETNLAQLTSGTLPNVTLMPPRDGVTDRRPSLEGAPAGVLHIEQCTLQRRPTFLDYIRGGLELAFSVAIDFTASNGDPRLSTSLHHISALGTNPYIDALMAVGSIIQDYDTDKMFPAFGFGARFRDGSVNHAFPLNGNPAQPECHFIEGIVAAYQQAISSVELFGPTNFAPIINSVARIAASNKNAYQVLLIITDGAITDTVATISAIVAASRLPMSIIIVGVGDGDFETMNLLDADEAPLQSRGQTMARDIVQFVPMRNFVGSGPATRAALAAAVLEELPDQLVGYMQMNNIAPNPPPPPYVPQGAAAVGAMARTAVY